MSPSQLDFSELEKVRPPWVIDALRAMASYDLVAAATGLRRFEEDPYYSAELSNITAPDVPFLLALLKPDLPICRPLTLLLGSLVGLNVRADGETEWQRFDDLDSRRHQPSQIAVATAAAIRDGHVAFNALLDAPDATLRCAAAWALYQMAPIDTAALAHRLTIETDEEVRIALIIALVANDVRLPSEGEVEGSTAANIRRIVTAQAPIDASVAAAFARLLVAPPRPTWLFANGMHAQFAASRLLQLGPREPARFELLRQAYATLSSCAPTEDTQAPINVIEKALGWVAFPDDTASQCTLDRTTLTAAQRFVLNEFVVDSFSRCGLEAQQAFVRGDAALDSEVVVADRRQSIAAHVLHARTVGASLEELFEVLSRSVAPQRLFELSLELLAGHLGPGVLLAARDPIARWFAATVTEPRVADYVTRLCNELQREPDEFESIFLFHPYLTELRPSPREFDSIALHVLAAPLPEVPAWLLTFPSARRAELVAQLHATVAVDLWQFCEQPELASCLIDRYLNDACTDDEAMAAQLAPVPTATLRERCGAVVGLRKQALDELLTNRLQRTSLTLSARKIWTMRLELRLPNGSYLLTLNLERWDETGALDLLVSMIEQSPQCVVTVYSSVPETVVAALRLRLNNRISIVDA